MTQNKLRSIVIDSTPPTTPKSSACGGRAWR
jgi:hypothetical protein